MNKLLKTNEEILELLYEIEERERDNYNESRKSAGINCCAACMASGAMDIVREIRDFMVGKY